MKAASELLPNAKDSEKKAKLLGILNDDVVRIERLITDYSNMLKGEALEAKLQLTRFDLIKLVKKVADEYQQVINNTKKNISIEVNNLIKKKTFVIGFESRIEQVISNILENSISFSPEKSTLRINIESKNNYAKIIITDEGPGFNESNIGKVFERFSYFAKRLIYEENPEVLGKDEYKKIHRAIAGQILSTNDEKWNTVPKAFKDIDDLRVKYEELKDEKTLAMLDDLSEYIEEIQKKYESA